ncbi:dihydropteroate synthase [Halobacteria archaeon AArc-m2/3/4]|uniref:Dihydropteroate synthase n=1 Tax=Natronoglomus mannanivorans TaxID=2979990 RepID=A0ABT2QL34_9EURY|nr:dihydropteroate synthase [Halobacteria archaeon AArc-m2/3/4]
MRTVEVGDLSIGDGHAPKIMSVLNMSDNSGYKPSVHIDTDQAAAAVDEQLVPAGADIIDIGLQSANPKYETKPVEYELERLDAAAEVIEKVESDTVFSLETRYAEVAEEGIQRGFDIVNDVCGFADPEMRPTVEAYDVPVVKMASPPDLERPGALKTIDDVFEALERGGFTDRTIIDPAFGGWYDGKTFEDNWEMFRRLREFRAFECPILTATNREDFLGDLAGRPETDDQLEVSLAAATLEVARGANVIRTHDTRETADVVQVAHALSEERTVRRNETENEVAVSELFGASRREANRHLSLSDRVTGRSDHSSTLTFVVTDVPDADVDVIHNAAELCEVTVGTAEDRVFLSGTVAALAAFLERLPVNTDALETVAESVRESITRE